MRLIETDNRSKIERLLRHIDVIRGGRVKPPHDAHWREIWDLEIDEFPHGPFDDQIDAMSQALDFLCGNPNLRKGQQRCAGVMINNRGVPTFASQAARLGIRPSYSGLSRQRSMKRIFPRQDD